MAGDQRWVWVQFCAECLCLCWLSVLSFLAPRQNVIFIWYPTLVLEPKSYTLKFRFGSGWCRHLDNNTPSPMKLNTLKHLICLLALANAGHGVAATAARPINDGLGSATVINTTRVTFSNQSGPGATVERAEPGYNGVAPARTTWYRLVMPFTGFVTGLASTAPGNTPRVVLWGTAFQGRTFGELTGAGEDTAFSTYRRASAAFNAGQSVLISLDASAATSLTIIVNRDLADDALTAPLVTTTPTTLNSDLRQLTTTAEEESYLPSQKVAWAALTSAEASLLLDTLGSSAAGEEIATNLVLFTGDPLTGLTVVAEGSNVPDSNAKSLVLSPTATQLYYVAYSSSSDVGRLSLNLNSNVGAGSFQFVTPEGYGLTLENAGTATAWVRRSSAAGTATVDCATTDGSAEGGLDFTAIPTTSLSFASGEFFKPVPVSITADSVADDYESLTLDLSNPSSGATLPDEPFFLMVITDGTSSSALTLSVPSTKVMEGSSFNITVTRTGSLAGQASAWVVPASSADAFINLPAQVVFGPGQSVATVQVTLADDPQFGGDKSAIIDLSNLQGVTDVGEPVTLTIQDDDAYQPIAARYRVLTNVSSTSRDPGLLEITTTALGACTGKLQLGMVSYPVTGIFDAQGQCRITLARTSGGPIVTVLRAVNAMHLLRCEIKEAGSILTHSGESYPVVARTAANPHPKTGRYTTSSDGLAIKGTPNALLFSSTIANTGIVSGVGFTADNKAFTFSGPLNADNAVPVLVGNALGYIASSINYHAAAVGITSTSTVRWLKRPVAAAGILAGGVDVAFNIATSGYIPPAPKAAAMLFLNSGASPLATLDAGDAFAAPITVTMAVPKVNILVPASNGLKLTIIPSTGNFSGSVIGNDGKVHTIRGILSTGSAQAVGNVFGPTYSSSMTFF
jgi:hypothetical protein